MDMKAHITCLQCQITKDFTLMQHLQTHQHFCWIILWHQWCMTIHSRGCWAWCLNLSCCWTSSLCDRERHCQVWNWIHQWVRHGNNGKRKARTQVIHAMTSPRLTVIVERLVGETRKSSENRRLVTQDSEGHWHQTTRLRVNKLIDSGVNRFITNMNA